MSAHISSACGSVSLNALYILIPVHVMFVINSRSCVYLVVVFCTCVGVRLYDCG